MQDFGLRGGVDFRGSDVRATGASLLWSIKASGYTYLNLRKNVYSFFMDVDVETDITRDESEEEDDAFLLLAILKSRHFVTGN